MTSAQHAFTANARLEMLDLHTLHMRDDEMILMNCSVVDIKNKTSKISARGVLSRK
jgi:hypothetical protein